MSEKVILHYMALWLMAVLYSLTATHVSLYVHYMVIIWHYTGINGIMEHYSTPCVILSTLYGGYSQTCVILSTLYGGYSTACVILSTLYGGYMHI